MSSDMNIPKGMCCFDCQHFMRCRDLFGCHHLNVRCDFSPSRFRAREDSGAPAEQTGNSAMDAIALAEQYSTVIQHDKEGVSTMFRFRMWVREQQHH
jgi:hypothetical protein